MKYPCVIVEMERPSTHSIFWDTVPDQMVEKLLSEGDNVPAMNYLATTNEGWRPVRWIQIFDGQEFEAVVEQGVWPE